MLTTIYSSKVNPGTAVNKLGKFLYKNIDGAFKMSFKAMSCEILMRMYFQVPGDADSMEEMIFSIDIVSYANKIRINITEQTEMEKTIGQIIIDPDKVDQIDEIKKKILNRIQKYIAKEYAEFDFVY